MAEYPILFNGEMVRAILDGRKTQTRRVIKPQPKPRTGGWIYDGKYFVDDDTMWDYLLHNVYGEKGSPYGSLYGDGTGDLLWVRETWVEWDAGIAYRADTLDRHGAEGADSKRCRLDYGVKWKPSIHMPRKASRITLRVTDVRVERVQEISHDDAYNEGIETDIWDQAAVARNYAKPDSWFQMWSSDLSDYVDLDELYRASFRTLWDSINASRGFGWDANPWVWVVSFERVTP